MVWVELLKRFARPVAPFQPAAQHMAAAGVSDNIRTVNHMFAACVEVELCWGDLHPLSCRRGRSKFGDQFGVGIACTTTEHQLSTSLAICMTSQHTVLTVAQ